MSDLIRIGWWWSAVTAVVCTASTAMGGDAIVDKVTFNQIDWEIAPGVVIAENSRWGEVTITYAPGSEISYINVVANNNARGEDMWIVRNLFVSPAENDPAPPPVTTTFDLALIGGVEEVDFAILEYYVNVESTPISSIPPPTGPVFPDTSVGDATYRTGGGGDGNPDFRGPGDPQLPIDPPPPLQTDETCDVTRTGVPNIQAETNQCYTAMLANSLEWLSDYWQLGLTDDADTIVDDLDTATGRADRGTLFHRATIEGLLKYVKDKSLPVTVHFQSQWVGADVKKHGRTATRDGGTPTWEYIKKELQKGQDVSLTYQRDTGGAHGVVVTGAYKKKNGKLGIRIQDDTRQTQTGDGNTGARSTSSDIGTNGTRMNVLSRPKNKVTGVFSISPTLDAMIDYILKKCNELFGLLDALLADGGFVSPREAQQIVELFRIQANGLDNLFFSIADLQPTNVDAQASADAARLAARDGLQQTIALRDFVEQNPGTPVTEQLLQLEDVLDFACMLTKLVEPLLQTGSCCLYDGSCVPDLLSDTCLSVGGTYQGDGVGCTEVICPVNGACCLEDGACTEGTETDCTDAGGDYLGDGSICAGDLDIDGIDDACEKPRCRGDVDGDNSVRFDDLLLVLRTWGACPDPCPPSCPADLDGDCTVGASDLIEVLSNWGDC